MLSSLFSSVLSKVLRKYFKGFESRNIKFSLSGEVDLLDLELEETALDDLHLPLKIKQGYIGKLQLIVPWQNLGEHSTIVRVSDVLIIVGPKSLDEYTDESEKVHRRKATQSRLNTFTSFLTKRRKHIEQDEEKPRSHDSFIKRLISTVTNNLQLYVENIHIRYEDDLTNPLRPFSIGITLDHFAVESADNAWRPIVGRTEDEVVHKLFTLKHFAVYWDTYSFMNPTSVMELKAKMYSSIYSTINKAKHTFILEPLSAEIKLVWNREDMLKKDIPKSAGKLLVDKFGLNLREDQYKDVILLLSRITAWSQGKKFHKLRPTVPVRESPGKWWDYAVNSVLDQYRERRKKWSWTYIKQRQDDKRTYTKIWRRVKLGISLSGTEDDALTQIEDRYSYEDILYFRTLSELYLKREEQEKGRKQLLEEEKASSDEDNSLFSWMGSWAKSKFTHKKPDIQSPHIVENESDKLNEDEWRTLYKSLNYHEDLHEIDTFYAPQSIEFTMNALIINASIMLRTQLGEPLVGCMLESFQFSTDIKDKWITLKAELADMQAHDYFTPKTRFKNIIFTNNQVKRIFSMQFDINPANINADYALDITSNPINIVMNAQLIKRMMTFFVDPLSDTAVDFSSNTPSMPKTSVLNTMLMYKKRVYVNVDIQAPNIMVPENPTNDLSSMLVLVLGRLLVSTKQAAVTSMTAGLTDTTDPTKRSSLSNYYKQDPNDFTSMVYESNEPYIGANATEGESSANWIRNYYDSYNISLVAVQAWVTDVSQRDSVIRQASLNKISDQHILEPFNLNLAIRSCKVNIGSLTNIIFEGSTPEIKMMASSVQIRALKHIVLGFKNDISSASMAVPKKRRLVGKDVFSQAVLDVLNKNRQDTSPNTGILLEGRFFVPSILILLKRPVATEGNIIKITLDRFGLKCRQTERELVANGSLKDLIVEDLMQNFGDQYRYLATSSRTAEKLNLTDKAEEDEEESHLGDNDQQSETQPKEGPSFVFNNVNFNNVDEYHYDVKQDEEIDEKNELIVLRFRSIAETSPAYQNIDNMLDVTFNALSLIINRKTIAYLLNEVSFITYEHQEKQKKREEKDRKETTGSLSAVSREVNVDSADHDNLNVMSDQGNLAMTKPYKEIVATPEEDDAASRLFENRITFRVGLQIKTINVLLNDHAKAMGVIQMRGMNTLMKIQNNGIFIHAVLERARIKDMTGPAKFRNILDVRGDNVMEMDFAIAPCIEFPEVEEEYRVGVKVNSLRMIYVERFVEEVASFFGVFQNLFEAAAVAVAERLEQIYKDDTKMLRFYVEMNTPMIIVPASACTKRNEAKSNVGDALIAQIGEVVIQNAFIKSYTMFEEISIRVQNVTMTTGKFKQDEIKARDEPVEKGPLILQGLDANIDVERPINPIAIRTYGTAVKATVAIPKAKLGITPEQISTLLDVWNDNILFMPSPELIRAQRKNAEVQRNQDKLLSKRLSEVELFEWNSLILNLEIQEMQFEVFDYQTAPEVTPESLSKLKAEGFEVNVTAASYGMTKVDIHLMSLKAEDTMKRRGDVEVVPEFREFLVPLPDKQKEPAQYSQFLSGTMIMHANQHQDINLVVDGFRIIPIPELIFSFINFTMPIINKLYKVLDRRTKILDLLNPIQSQIELRRDPEKKHEKDEKERQRIAAGVAMQLTLSRAQISLVEDMGDASSRGFVLNTNAVLDIAIYNYQTRIAVNTKGTEMFKCKVVKQGQGISIIEPFDIATDVTSGPQFIDVSTSLKTVRIVLSYSDIKVGANIANQWMAAMPLMQTATPYSQTFEESKEAISSAKDNLGKAMDKKDVRGVLELSSDSEDFNDDQMNSERRKKKMARLQEKHLDMEAKKTLDLIDQRLDKEDEAVKIRQSRQTKSSVLQDPSDVRIARSVARKKEKLGMVESRGDRQPVVVQATNVHDNPFERDFEGGENNQHLKGSIDLEEDEQVKTLMSIGRSRETKYDTDDTSSHEESKEDKKAIEAEREEQEREIITLQSTTPKSTQKIVLPPYRLEILLLDDVRGYDRPLTRLLVDEFTSEIVITQSTTSFLAWTRLSGSYYNSINSAWEPFLEPWKVQAKLGGSTVQVWSTDVMNLNMTAPLLNTMKNTMEEWMDDWKATVGNDRPANQPVNDLDEAAQINKKYKGKDVENAVNYQNQVNPYDITDQAMRDNKRVFSQLEDNDRNQFVGDNTYDARGQLKTGKQSQQLATLAEADNQIRQRNALSNEVANANDRAVMAQTSDDTKFGEFDASEEDYEEEDAGTLESNTLKTDYYIRNVTGMPMFFSLTGQETRLLHNKKQAILMSTVADDVTGTFVRIGGIRPRQNLSIQVEGFERVDHIDLGNTGKFTINAGVNKKIVYQVKYQRGSKVIIFTSPVLLQNQTDTPLEALVTMEDVKHRFVVQPNRTISVPLQYLTHNAEIRFRPYELGYKWSSMSFFLPNLHPSAHQLPCDLEDHYQVASASSSSEESSSYHHRISPNDFFLYSISIDQDTSQKFADQHIIKIRPPLTLENALPVDIKYRIFNKQGTAFLEGKLHKGQTIPVHNLRYEQELCCSIFIAGYSWSDKEFISSSKRRENTKSISVYDEKKHPLSIRVDNRFDLEGCRRVTFWSSYWLLNRTGLPLLFAYDKKKRTHHAKLVAGQSEEGCAAFSGSSRGQPKEWHVDNFFKGEPLMMSLSSDRLKRLNFFIKAANSKWSSGIAVRSIPQEGAHVQIEEAVAGNSDQPPRLYELSLIKSGAKNRFSRTEVITLVPRYVLVNNTDKTLFLRQEGDAREYKLDPYEHAPFHWPHAHKDKLLRFRIDKNKCNWSGAFTIESTDYFTVQMLDEDLPKSYVMRVRIKIEQGVMIVNFVEETNNALYRIENGLPDSIFVQQQSTASMVLHVPTGKTQSWGWLEPSQPRILDIILPDKTVYSMKPYKLKEHTPFKYIDESGEIREVVVQVLGLGMTRVVRIKPRSDVPNKKEKSSLDEGLEKMKVSLMFQGVGISVINELPEELLYLSIDGIKAEFVDMTSTRSLEVEIQDCQIDNQTLSTFTPIMLHSNTERPPQFLKFTAVKDNTYDTIQYFRYLSVLVREMWLTLDQELLLKALSFADYIMADLKSSKKPAEGDLDEIQPLDLAVAEDDHSQMIYNQFFLLNPIAANLTFIARKGKVDDVRRSNMTNILLRIPDQILPSVENAPVRLRALNLQDTYMSKNEMATRLLSFIMSQIGDQVIGVVGSLDILGNPINMFGNIGEGIHDFFYEPSKGITLGAKEFGYGLGKGSKSLAKKTVYGVSDATTKITSSVSHGVAALSMDRDYQRKRRAERLGHQPSNALKGLGYGLKDFSTGIVRGITGLVEQPIKGGREEGPKGVAKGVGKGIAGLVVKPVVGTVDLISRTAEGIRNNTQIHEKQVTRKRPPRNFASYDRRTVQLREYNLYEARGLNLLTKLKEERVRNQQYMFHEVVAHERVILVSDKMIYFLNSAANEVIWRTHFTNISRIHIARHMQPPTVTIDTIDARDNQRHLPCITVEQASTVEHKLRAVCHDWQLKHIRDFHPDEVEPVSYSEA